MPSETVQKLLQDEINRLNLEIPATVFQFGFDKITAEEYLRLHPDVPFILRASRLDRTFVLDIPSEDRNNILHLLVSLPKSDEKEFQLSTSDKTVFTAFSSLHEYFEILWDPDNKRIRSVIGLSEFKGKQAWEQFKLHQLPNGERKISDMGINSSPQEGGITSTPEEHHAYSQQNAALKRAGDGQTGFAMAKAFEEQRLQKQIPNRINAASRTLTTEEQRFNLLLKNLLIKGDEFKQRRREIPSVRRRMGEDRHLIFGYWAVLQLEKALKAEGAKFFADPTEKSYFKFKNQCDRHIKSARTILDNHRGLSEFLINLFIGVCTLGLGLIVKSGINLAMDKPFFFVHNTDSAQKLNEIDRFINETKPKP